MELKKNFFFFCYYIELKIKINLIINEKKLL